MSKVAAADKSLRALIHPPSSIGKKFAAYAEQMYVEPGQPDKRVRWHLPAMDEYVIPGRQGDTIGIVARSSHGKTTGVARLAKKHAELLVGLGLDKEYCVVVVTLETAVEPYEAFFQSFNGYSKTDIARGLVDPERIRREVLPRPKLPVWMVGQSITDHSPTARMTGKNIFKALQVIEKWGQKEAQRPCLIVIDYIQLMQPDEGMRARNKFEDVISAMDEMKFMVREMQVPAIVAIQAGRAVDSRESGMPTMQDLQYSSSIEQGLDCIVGFFRPSRHYKYSEWGKIVITADQYDFNVFEELFCAKVLKQRDGPAGRTFPLRFDIPRADLEEFSPEILLAAERRCRLRVESETTKMRMAAV